MSNDPSSLAELLRRREALVEELAELDRQLFEGLRTFSRALEMMEEVKAITKSIRPQSGGLMQFMPASVMLSSSGEEEDWRRRSDISGRIATLVSLSLQRRGNPLATRELLHELRTTYGFEVPGKDAVNNLSAHLSRLPTFVNTARGWWFAKPENEDRKEKSRG